MGSLELNDLAVKIDGLLRAFQKIKQENTLLRQQLAELGLQQQILVDKKLKVAGQIRSIVNQLREKTYE